MKTAKAEEEAAESGNVLPETQRDPLVEYRRAIGELQSGIEKAQTMRSIESGIAAQCGRLEADREAALTLASEAPGVEGELDSQLDIAELTQKSTKLEVMRRKLSAVTRRLQEAEEELSKGAWKYTIRLWGFTASVCGLGIRERESEVE